MARIDIEVKDKLKKDKMMNFIWRPQENKEIFTHVFNIHYAAPICTGAGFRPLLRG
jgi:hypothetical protein